MEVRRFDNAAAWLGAVEPLLLKDEARHDLPLGIANTLIRHPSVYPTKHLWAVERSGLVVGAALQTPPHNLAMARPEERDVVGVLAEAIDETGMGLPGVVAADPECGAFADAWSSTTGATARQVMGQGVYALRDVRDLATASGTSRRADRPRDLERILGWLSEFDDEVVPPEIRGDLGERRRRATTLFEADEGGFWLWEDGDQPVSMTGVGSFTPNGVRIGPAYTPPNLRGRGYATSLVTEVSRAQLVHRAFCFLHTDLANPTSNSIYKRIGYEHVCDSTVIAFDRS